MRWFKPLLIGGIVLGLVFANGLPRPFGSGVGDVAADVISPWSEAAYSFKSEDQLGFWVVREVVRFESRSSPGAPSLRNVRIDCFVTWSLVYRIEIQKCSPNLPGTSSQVTMNGRPATLYYPGVVYKACIGIKDFGESCGTFASYKPIANYNDDYGGYVIFPKVTVTV